MNKLTWIVRLILFYLTIFIASIFIVILGLMCHSLGNRNVYWVVTRWSHLFIWAAKFFCGLNYQVVGKENLPTTPAVVLCNHQSTWETIFMQVLLPQQSWILKRELLFIPFFGLGLLMLRPIAINRKNKFAAKKILNKGAKKLSRGNWMLIYPEGTRVAPGSNKPYSRTGAALAIKAQVPIVPIAHNAGNFWPRGLWIKQPGTIKVIIGQTVSPLDQTPDELTQQIETWIKAQQELLS